MWRRAFTSSPNFIVFIRDIQLGVKIALGHGRGVVDGVGKRLGQSGKGDKAHYAQRQGERTVTMRLVKATELVAISTTSTLVPKNYMPRMSPALLRSGQ